jgi:hypothetical protein
VLLKRVREARKLNNLPNSLLDYNDAKRGLEPPAERRAREQRENALPIDHSHQTCRLSAKTRQTQLSRAREYTLTVPGT